MAGSGGQRPAIVFLHYFGGSRRAWDGVIAQLGDRYDCFAPDLRGFGDAWNVGCPFTVDTYADDVAELIADCGIERFVLVGHSMGGKIALALAARRPAGLASLVLLAPSPPSPEPMSDDDREKMLASHGDRNAARATARKIVGRPLAPIRLEEVVQDMLVTSAAAWRAWYEGGSRETLTAVGHLSLPTLVLSGSDDSVIPRTVLESDVMPCLSNARLISIAGSGHLLPLEATDEVAGLIERAALAGDA